MNAMTGEFEARVIERLVRGASLDGLGLGRVDGRWDLRGRTFGGSVAGEPVHVAGFEGRTVSNLVSIAGRRLQDLDLRGANWQHLRLTNSIIDNCLFDGADLRDMRVWGVQVFSSSFRESDLRGASLAGRTTGRKGRLSSWHDVDFSRADLRGTAHGHELYQDCSFEEAKLDQVDFESARHVRSKFAGRVSEVSFRSGAASVFRRFPNNEMLGVDFSRAEVVWCSFRGLTLTDASLPTANHVILQPKVEKSTRLRQKLRELDLAKDLINLDLILEGNIEEGPSAPNARGILHHSTLGETEAERLQALKFLSDNL